MTFKHLFTNEYGSVYVDFKRSITKKVGKKYTSFHKGRYPNENFEAYKRVRNKWHN